MDSLLDVIVRLEQRIEIDQSMLETPMSDFDKFLVQCDNDLKIAINCIKYCANNLSLTDIEKLLT